MDRAANAPAFLMALTYAQREVETPVAGLKGGVVPPVSKHSMV